MHLLAGSQAGEATHVLVVNLDKILPVVKTENHLEIGGVVYLLYAVVMEQVILLLLLQKLDVELGALRFLLHYDQLPD